MAALPEEKTAASAMLRRQRDDDSGTDLDGAGRVIREIWASTIEMIAEKIIDLRLYRWEP